MSFITAGILVLSLATSSTLWGQTQETRREREQSRLDAFASSNADRKQEILRSLRADTTSSVDEIGLVVANGLDDRNPHVKRAALVALGERAVLRNVPDARERYRHERQLLHSMNQRLFALMDDEDRSVREAALEAASSLEYDLLQEGDKARVLHVPLGQALLARYSVEHDSALRVRIVNVLAWFRPEPAFSREAKMLVVRALSDQSEGSRQAASRAVLNNHFEDLLPDVVNLLTDSSEAVRSSAAITIGQFGSISQRFVPRLQSALVNESSPLVRQNLATAIQRLSR